MPGHAPRHSSVSCAKMAERIDLPFRLWTRIGRRKHKFNRIRQVAPMSPQAHEGAHRERAHWHHVANTIEPSACGGDAALCQITLTTCSVCLSRRQRQTASTSHQRSRIIKHIRPTACMRQIPTIKTLARASR